MKYKSILIDEDFFDTVDPWQFIDRGYLDLIKNKTARNIVDRILRKKIVIMSCIEDRRVFLMRLTALREREEKLLKERTKKLNPVQKENIEFELAHIPNEITKLEAEIRKEAYILRGFLDDKGHWKSFFNTKGESGEITEACARFKISDKYEYNLLFPRSANIDTWDY